MKATVLLDETEIHLKEDKVEILNLLNSGYRKGQFAIRTGEPGKTGERQLQFFIVFGFKALAGTKELAETLRTGSIIFYMSKATRQILMQIDQAKTQELKAKLQSALPQFQSHFSLGF
jgi:hypothetical protein